MSSYIRHQVLTSDTLRGLALKYLGDHDLWVAIVELNSLTPAEFDLVGIKELLIPVEIGSSGGYTQSPYHTDLKVKNGGLMIAPGGGAGVVTGPENVLLAIVRQLSTDRGSMVHHPNYGLDLARFVATEGTPLFLRLLRVEVERVILRDPRVSFVKNVRVIQNNRQIEIGADITLIGGRDKFKLATSRRF